MAQESNMKKLTMKPFIFKSSALIMTLFLVSCGGSSESPNTVDSSENSTDRNNAGNQTSLNVVTDISAQSTQEEPEISPIKMEDLVIAETFEFTNKTDISVLLDLPDLTDERAYVSVYKDYQLLSNQQYYPHMDSRVVSGHLAQGKFSEQFVNLTNASEYLVEVWFYDGRQPLQKVVAVDVDKLQWQ